MYIDETLCICLSTLNSFYTTVNTELSPLFSGRAFSIDPFVQFTDMITV